MDAFRTCLACREDHERALHDLAVLLAQTGDSDMAVLLLEQVIELNPGHARAMRNLGVLLARKGRLDEAGRWLRKAGVIPAHTKLERVPGARGPVLRVRPAD